MLPEAEPTEPTPPEIHSLEELVMAGYRFVTLPYVFSVLVLSIRKNMGNVYLVKIGDWPMRELFRAACVSALFGWWGFPFGFAYTILSLWHLWHGGRDMTWRVLEQSQGRKEAKRIMAAAPKVKLPATIWWVRLVILIPVAALVIVYFRIAPDL